MYVKEEEKLGSNIQLQIPVEENPSRNDRLILGVTFGAVELTAVFTILGTGEQT